MEAVNGLLWEISPRYYLLVTVIIAGGAAFMTGRAIARSWLSPWQLVVYMLILALATRFFHFALFYGTLLSPHYYLVDLATLLIIGFFGMRITRSRQMARQYSFMFERSNLLGWKLR